MFKDFDAARRAYDTSSSIPRVEFQLGDEHFTLLADPTLGDTFECADVPDLRPEDFDKDNPAHLAIVRGLCKYIERMLPIEDRARWNEKALFRVPVSHFPVILEIGDYITEQVINRPTRPPTRSSGGRPQRGTSSRKRSGSTRRSS